MIGGPDWHSVVNAERNGKKVRENEVFLKFSPPFSFKKKRRKAGEKHGRTRGIVAGAVCLLQARGLVGWCVEETTSSTRSGQTDAALATQLCFGVLQNQMLLDFYLSRFSNIPLKRMEEKVVQALRLGAYQLLFLDKIPQSAAVNSSVELAKRHCKNPRAAGWVNGI